VGEFFGGFRYGDEQEVNDGGVLQLMVSESWPTPPLASLLLLLLILLLMIEFGCNDIRCVSVFDDVLSTFVW
jgi:hypothetical protein